MLLPFAEHAYIDDEKLIGYCLSETHLVGKHKARLFKAALGLTADNYQLLKETIATGVLLTEAHNDGFNQQGDLFTVDFIVTHESKQAPVRTSRIVRFGESFPRLVSCYVNS